MQQNFIKMIDKNINDMEKDHQFIEKAEQEIREEAENSETYHANQLYGSLG